MKKSLLIVAFILLFSNVCILRAQTRYIYTVAGTGMGFSGDGGPATAARLDRPKDVATDIYNNIFIADAGNNRIRKVSATGHIITTIAGNGSAGSSGDGGPATAAALNNPTGVAVDGMGNVYIADQGNNKIRKISPDGIISTVAGTGSAGFSGDGGPASAAQLSAPTSVALDRYGNLYIGDGGNPRIRKVDTANIITTIAGGGIAPFVGYSTWATDVSLCTLQHFCVDASRNIYFSTCGEVLKLTPSGFIYLVQATNQPYGVTIDTGDHIFIARHPGAIYEKNLGTGELDTVIRTGAVLGDGGPAILGNIISPYGISYNLLGELYVAEYGRNRIRIITPHPFATYPADSFGVFINEQCAGPEITLQTARYAPTLNQTTFFGDGTSFSSSVNPASSSCSAYATFQHAYDLPGTYTMKTLLKDGSTVLDSLTYSYQYKLCNTMQVRFYIDANASMNYEPGEDPLSGYVVKTRVDSNGIPVDTISATSGFYYTAYGAIGDIYTFSVISLPAGLATASPAAGIISDTIEAGTYNNGINNIGLICSGISGKDFRVHMTNRCGSRRYVAQLTVDNLYCSSSGTPATLSLNFSPKYNYYSAYPAPDVISANTLTWNFTDLTASSAPTHISVTGKLPYSASPYLPGDTVHSLAIIGPFTGDSDTSDNTCDPVDTVKSGYDPNFIDVSPAGYIPSGAQLEYTIGFENTGNDTAFNIYVLDTLSDDVDPSTLQIVAASAAMDIFKFTAGGHTIVKFDFPHINLLDSSHHNECHGMLVYTVQTKTGLPDCTHIQGRAGIYFDENPVVITNTIENIIGDAPVLAEITGSNTVCPGSGITLAASYPGGTWSTSNSNATVSGGLVSGLTEGSVFIYYSVPAACGPAITQFLVSVGAPVPAYITAPSIMCAGSTASISASVPGGSWSNYSTNTSLTGGSLTAITAGIDTLYYTISASCGTAVAQHAIQIDTAVIPAAISGISNICEGTTVTLSDITPGGVWSYSNSTANITSAGALTGVATGTGTAYYSVTNACGTHTTSFDITVQSVSDCGATHVATVSSDNFLQIFPNPASKELTIMMAGNLFQSVAVVNQVGQCVLRCNLTTSISSLNVSHLPNGLYYLMYKGAADTRTLRFVKQ